MLHRVITSGGSWWRMLYRSYPSACREIVYLHQGKSIYKEEEEEEKTHEKLYHGKHFCAELVVK
jgi:hypothetical protein